MGKTSIEWTDATWNTVTGCTAVSAGCANCWARSLHNMRRKAHLNGKEMPLQYHAPFSIVQCHEDRLEDPLHWRKARKVALSLGGDLFHDDVPFEFIDKVFAVMALCPQHTFQVLTKRPERMKEYLTAPIAGPWKGRAFREDVEMSAVDFRLTSVLSELFPKLSSGALLNRACRELDKRIPGDGFHRVWPLPNVWLGVSVENQQAADERIPLLLQTPAAVRFISAEPLLSGLDILHYLGYAHEDEHSERGVMIDNPDQRIADEMNQTGGLPMHDPWVKGLDLVIAGGESGGGRKPHTRIARPMRPSWVRSLRDQCKAARVCFLFKQWGEWAPSKAEPIRGQHTGGGAFVLEDGRLGCQGDWWDGRAEAMDLVGKHAAGRLLDGVEHNEFPEVR